MFTGIIKEVGEVELIENLGGDARLAIRANKVSAQLEVGDSICVSGVCLTAARVTATGFACDVSNETLSLTTLGQLQSGNRVNLEPALTATTPLGGHILSGHVDGLGSVSKRYADARSERFEISLREELTCFMARKGSVAIDGVSLTINKVAGKDIEVNILPHTLAHTTFGSIQPGQQVNVEVDIIARYLERLANSGRLGEDITWERLRAQGFIK